MTTSTFDLAFEILPYPGLRPFCEDETHLYFGREQHRGELLKRLAATRFVAVIGTSGSGKSSLVRAGLLPDLVSGYLAGSGSDWVIVESKPGADPLGRLVAALVTAGWHTDAAALRTNSSQLLALADRHLTPGQHLLVLVDQFEELFRLKTSEDPAEDADEKAAFVRLLLNAGGQRMDVAAQHPCVHVVMAMRSEFLGRASVYRGLPEAIDQGQYLIPRLSREQLRKAIESPARVAGGEVEEALVQSLLNELGDDQDQLPVLQHALMRCWMFRDGGGRVGLEAYEKSGQLANALSIDANEALAETRTALGVRGEEIVKRAFQALRETDANGGQTRRPTTVQVLCEMAECSTDELTTALAPFRQRSFVLPPPDATLESSTLLDISHEALLRGWDALRRWIDEDNLDRVRYVRLANRAAEEQDSDSPQYLVPPQLDMLVKFWTDRNPSKAWALRYHKGYEQAKSFLDESEQHQRALEQEAADRQAEESRRKQALLDAVEKRTRTRTRAIVGSLLGLTVLVGGGFALQNSRAQGNSLQVALIAAKLDSVPEAKVEARLQLAAEAVRRRSDPETQNGLFKALFSAAMPRDAAWGAGLTQVASMAVSPGDRRLYAVADGRLRVIDLASGQERLSKPMSEYPGAGGSGSPLLLTSGEKLLMLWNRSASVIDGSTLEVLAPPISDATALTASADGTKAAFLLVSEVVILCDLASNCESKSSHSVKDLAPEDLELSADGKSLVIIQDSNEGDRQIALFDTMPWKQQKARPFRNLVKLSINVDKDHVHLCTPDALRQYDAHNNTLDETVVRRFAPEAERCRFFGERTVTSHADGGLRVWDDTGTFVTQVSARVKDSLRMALGDRTLVAAGEQVQVWDITPYGRQSVDAKLLGFGRANSYAYGEDQDQNGKWVALDSRQVTDGPKAFKSFRLAAISDSLKLAAYIPEQSRYAARPSELTLASLSTGDAPARLWSWPIDSKSRNIQVTISPDERYVGVTREVSGKASIVILDARDGSEVRTLPGESSVFFAPTGEALAFEGSKLVIASLKGKTEPSVHDLQLQSERPVSAAFSGDGSRLALVASAPNAENSVVEVFEWPGLKNVGVSLKHSADVISLSFKSDSPTLLTSTSDGTTHVWDLATQKETLRIPPPGAKGTRAVFMPGGWIAILDESGFTKLPANPDALVAEACSRISRNLTREEWVLLVGGDIPYQKTCPDRP